MKPWFALLFGVLLLLSPLLLGTARGDDPPAEPAQEAAGGRIEAVEEGQPAAFAGFLIDEVRFSLLADLQLRLDAAEGKLANRESLVAELTTKVADLTVRAADAVAEHAAEPGWWSRYGFMVGVLVGVAGTVTAVYFLYRSTPADGGGG